jgi:hypothetical protein
MKNKTQIFTEKQLIETKEERWFELSSKMETP